MGGIWGTLGTLLLVGAAAYVGWFYVIGPDAANRRDALFNLGGVVFAQNNNEKADYLNKGFDSLQKMQSAQENLAREGISNAEFDNVQRQLTNNIRGANFATGTGGKFRTQAKFSI